MDSDREAPLSDSEPIKILSGTLAQPFNGGRYAQPDRPSTHQPQIAFSRQELSAILAVYGRKVAAGIWRDYAIDLLRDRAVFSIFRKSSEYPLYRIEKNPKLARKQGAYSVIATGGLILKRGHELRRVLRVLEDRPELKSI